MNKWGKWWQRQVLDSLMMNPPPPLTIILLCVFGSVFGIGFLCAHWMVRFFPECRTAFLLLDCVICAGMPDATHLY